MAKESHYTHNSANHEAESYLVQVSSGQYGIMTCKKVYLLDWKYSLEYLMNHFNLSD